jgi:hypothetical protein
MQKWEYLRISCGPNSKVIFVNGKQVGRFTGLSWTGEDFDAVLKQLGEQGWEVIGFTDNQSLLKRPIQ